MVKYIKPIYADTEKTEFKIPVKWEERYVLTVTAGSLKEAIERILRLDYELPEGEFLTDTFEIDYDRLES